MAPSLAQSEDGPPSAVDKWEAWTELGGYAANRSYARRGELALWAPFIQDADSLFFFDLRGKLFAEDIQEGNAALGYRFMTGSGWNPGVWIGFDRRDSEFGNNFDQVAFGLEALSADWDLRLNGYVPLNDREFVASSTSSRTTQSGSEGPGSVVVIGDDIFVVTPGGTTTATTITTQRQLHELALWGVDAEVGYRVPLDPAWGLSLNDASDALSGRHHDLRVFVGGFYFDHADLEVAVAGPRARLEWRIENVLEDWAGSRLTFETAWQLDDLRGDQIEGGMRLRIPLGGGGGRASAHDALTAQERRMSEGLKHNTDIVTRSKIQAQRQTTTVTGSIEPTVQPVEDAVTGVDFDSITFVNNGDDMNAALTAAGGNALLVAFGGSTSFVAPSVMVANQTLLGGGGLLQVRSRTTGLLYTYAAPGTRPTFQANQAPGITAADNAHIKSVDITGGAIGIQVPGPQRVVVDDATITGSVFGLSSDGSGATLIVRNSTISGGSAGIVSGDMDQTLVIENNVFSDLGTGVVIGDASGNVTSATLTAIGNTFAGAYTNYLLTFPNGTVNLVGTGNVDAATVRLGICIRDFFMTLNGSIFFEGGGIASATTCDIP